MDPQRRSLDLEDLLERPPGRGVEDLVLGVVDRLVEVGDRRQGLSDDIVQEPVEQTSSAVSTLAVG
jgi:hypothetical protein